MKLRVVTKCYSAEMDFQNDLSSFRMNGPNIFNKCSRRCGELLKYVNEEDNFLEGKAKRYIYFFPITLHKQLVNNFFILL